MQALPAVTRDGVRVVLRANVEFPDEAPVGAPARRRGHRALPLRVPAGPRPGVAERGAPARGLPPAPAERHAAPRGRPHLGRGPGGPGARRAHLREPRAGRAGAAPAAARAPTRSAPSCARSCARPTHGPLRILFPFLTGPLGPAAPRSTCSRRRASPCEAQGVEHAARVEVGVNIEVPSAALTADLLAGDVDFFSSAPTTSCSTCSRPTAATRACRRTTSRCTRRCCACSGRWWASARARACPSPFAARWRRTCCRRWSCVGLGVRELSMNPAAIPRVKAAVRAARASDLAELARGVPGPADRAGDRIACCVARWPRCWRRSPAF